MKSGSIGTRNFSRNYIDKELPRFKDEVPVETQRVHSPAGNSNQLAEIIIPV